MMGIYKEGMRVRILVGEFEDVFATIVSVNSNHVSLKIADVGENMVYLFKEIEPAIMVDLATAPAEPDAGGADVDMDTLAQFLTNHPGVHINELTPDANTTVHRFVQRNAILQARIAAAEEALRACINADVTGYWSPEEVAQRYFAGGKGRTGMKTYTNSWGKKFVVATARIVPACGYERSSGIVVDQCPFCLHTHRHGLVDDVGGIYGVREADCFRGEYMLIDESVVDVLSDK